MLTNVRSRFDKKIYMRNFVNTTWNFNIIHIQFQACRYPANLLANKNMTWPKINNEIRCGIASLYVFTNTTINT
jgi:hypothetical protein